MFQYSVPAGRSGSAMARFVEAALTEMREGLNAHQEGDRVFPEDFDECTARVTAIWDEIKSLRDLAAFSLSNAADIGPSYPMLPEDPMMVVAKNAVLLEFIDQELGENTSSSVAMVLSYIYANPILDHLPNDRPRVYH